MLVQKAVGWWFESARGDLIFMSKEIEIKVNIEKSAPLIEFLSRNGRLISESRQVDEYFSPTHRNFLDEEPVEEWFRIRDAQGSHSVNYKKWHYDKDGKSNFADEYEKKVDNIEDFKKIL